MSDGKGLTTIVLAAGAASFMIASLAQGQPSGVDRRAAQAGASPALMGEVRAFPGGSDQVHDVVTPSSVKVNAMTLWSRR